jgi:hypothetical protein
VLYIGEARQDDRHAAHLSLNQVLELLCQHVPSLEHDKDIGVAGNRRDDPLGLGRLLGEGVVKGEWTIPSRNMLS